MGYNIAMIDVHCHLDHPYLLPHLEKITKNPYLRILISSGIKPASWKANIDIQKKYPVNISLGFHPFFIESVATEELELLRESIKNNQVIAVGEIGLDYHKEQAMYRDYQKEVLLGQLKIAEEFQLPVIVHCRKAHDDFWKFIKGFDISCWIFHSFSGSQDDLKKALAINGYISYGFPVAYDNNVKRVEMLKITPLDRIVFETDAPYMKRTLEDAHETSFPSDIELVYNTSARILGMSLSDLKEQIFNNVKSIWNNLKEL
ncbi:MAG: TatD family hydrolase [Candidatus Margulisbacteria bacterium]|nr:TatD family hydrolase [Candidatus Margulisiibacteriota bacterium]